MIVQTPLMARLVKVAGHQSYFLFFHSFQTSTGLHHFFIIITAIYFISYLAINNTHFTSVSAQLPVSQTHTHFIPHSLIKHTNTSLSFLILSLSYVHISLALSHCFLHFFRFANNIALLLRCFSPSSSSQLSIIANKLIGIWREHSMCVWGEQN